MPDKKRNTRKVYSDEDKLYRYMSVEELHKLLSGETLVNNTDWKQKGAASTAHGFCFFYENFEEESVYDSYYGDDFEYEVYKCSFRDYRHEWERLAEWHFQEMLKKQNHAFNQNEMDEQEKKLYKKELRKFIRHHVVVEFIYKSGDFDVTIGRYGKYQIPESCITSYSLANLRPVKFSRLSAKKLKWHSIDTFSIKQYVK